MLYKIISWCHYLQAYQPVAQCTRLSETTTPEGYQQTSRSQGSMGWSVVSETGTLIKGNTSWDLPSALSLDLA